MSWRARIEEQLAKAEAASMRRELRTVESVRGPYATIRGLEAINLCHNDYLGLSREPEVIDAACAAAREWGTGSGASRLITGSSRLVAQLEEELAAFKGMSTALVFPTGYQASVGVVSSLAVPDDVVFVDRLAHSCLVDGARLSGAKLRVFPHNDMEKLAALLAAARGAAARWILVDGVYSMDGDFAPLPKLLELAHEHDATVVLDDAHGTGVAGATGRGTAEHFGIVPREHEERLVVIATLSKALGSQGGAALCAPTVRDWMVNRARTFVYTTGLAPAAAGGALAALRLVAREPQRVARLQQRARAALDAFRAAGLDTMASETPIVPLRRPSASSAVETSDRLRARGILALAIRPPTVPPGSCRLRVTINSLPSDAEMERALLIVVDECLRAGDAVPGM